MDKKIKGLVEDELEKITQDGLKIQDLQVISELVDIHKDLCNEEYWKEKKEAMKMRYNRGYGEYGREPYGREPYGRRRDGRGRYMAGNYRGEEVIEEIHGAYRDYAEGANQMNMGNYGAKNDTMKALDYMMQSVVQFIEMLKKDANSQEEIDLIQDYTRQISEM